MLIGLDDYPVHQAPVPLAQTAAPAINHYDRYFFNGYSPDGSRYFAAALGYYPNRRVMDAAFAVLRGDEIVSVIASRPAPADPTETRVGPMQLTVEEPMRSLRLAVDFGEVGLEADARFVARTAPVEEPRYFYASGPVAFIDYTRFTQWGCWEGRLTVDGETWDLSGGSVLGCRDRSWGIRPVGEQPPGTSMEPQFFWLWAPLWFQDVCLHFDVNEDGAGTRWHFVGAKVPLLDRDEEGPSAPGGTVAWARWVDYSIRWRSGTRWSESCDVRMQLSDGEMVEVSLEPLATFQMRALGYLHPEFGHGRWHGAEVVHTERWKVSETNPTDPFFLHCQQIVRASWGEKQGIGVLEQLAIGPHAPTGLHGLVEGFSPESGSVDPGERQAT